jgi:hypothetical protein
MPSKARAGRAKSGKAFIGTVMDPATGRSLRRLAVDRDTTIRTLIAEGILHVLQHYGQPISPELQRFASGE